MSYNIVGWKDGNLCQITLKEGAVERCERLAFDRSGPDGSVSNMMTPEAAKIAKEEAVDLSLSGVINKNKEENADKKN